METLEQLIELAQERQMIVDNLNPASSPEWIHAANYALNKTRADIADFVLSHDELFIALERQHMLYTSAFDEDQ